MNRDLQCDVHRNYPVIFMDIMKKSNKRLKCAKCASDQYSIMNFLYIPDIKGYDENSFFQSWPPLSNEILRDQIIKIKNEQINYNDTIIDFYDQFSGEIINILSEKKKQQLMDAQKIHEFQDKIIEQYCKLGEIEKLNQCIIQENKLMVDIEEDLQQLIDSQFNKVNENTYILSTMIKQYQLMNQLNLENANEIKERIFQILEKINIIPQNDFNINDETNIFNIENIEQKIQKQQIISQNNSIIQKNLMNLLNSIKEQLNYINYPLNILENCYFNNFIFISNYNDSKKYVLVQQCPEKNVYYMQKVKEDWNYVQCFINYKLKPNKKYEILISFNQMKNYSRYYIGLIKNQHTDSKYLDSVGLRFQFQHPDIFKKNQQNTFQFKVSISEQIFQCVSFPNETEVLNAINSNSINIDGIYYFGLQISSLNQGDKIEIISFNELDEFQ